jgi:hypothetical protein
MKGNAIVKVAYVFSTSGHTASYKLGKMILPQLEESRHGVEVVGMMFFDNNTYILRKGDPIGERLGKIARENSMLLMLCDQCALERGLAEGEQGTASRSTPAKACVSAASPTSTLRSPARHPTTSSPSSLRSTSSSPYHKSMKCGACFQKLDMEESACRRTLAKPTWPN